MDSGGPATEDPKCKRAIAWNRVSKVTARMIALYVKHDAARVKLEAERARLSGIASNTPCTCKEPYRG